LLPTVCINAVADFRALTFQFSTTFCTKIQTLILAQNRYCVYTLLPAGCSSRSADSVGKTYLLASLGLGCWLVRLGNVYGLCGGFILNY